MTNDDLQCVFWSVKDDKTPMMLSELKAACDTIMAKHGDVPVVFMGRVLEDFDLLFPVRSISGFRLNGDPTQPMAVMSDQTVYDDPNYELPGIGPDGFPIADYEEKGDDDEADRHA